MARNGTNTASESAPPRLSLQTDWHYAPAPEASGHIKLQPKYDLFIDGKWVAPAAGKTFETFNPATEKKLANIALADTADVGRAVTAARRAYDNVWSTMPGRERGKYLYRIARILQERAREFAIVETMGRWQAHPGIAGRRRPAGSRAFLLLCRMGRQARVRFPPAGGQRRSAWRDR